MAPEAALSIGDVAERTGVSEATLRMWEARHGFPRPRRLPSGHRRYSERDVELVRHVLEDRDRGLSLGAAIDRATSAGERRERSLFAGLRRRFPDLSPYVLPKRAMIALSHAIEDELTVRAERGVLFASFQTPRFFRAAEPRWRELARTADHAVALASFGELRVRRNAPTLVPLDLDDPLLREWSIVSAAPGYSACLVGVERPGQQDAPDLRREFETIWTVDPDHVDDAARICCGILARVTPELAQEVSDHLNAAPAGAEDRFGVAAAVTRRMVAYLGEATEGGRPLR